MNYISDILYWISTGLLVRQFFRTVYVDSKNRIAVAR